MKNKRHFFSTGITSLLMIFVVTALSIFGILTYMSARSDYLLTMKSAKSVQEYYLAVGEKEQVLCQLDELLRDHPLKQALEQLSFEIDDQEQTAVWRYPMNENSEYILKLKLKNNRYEILSAHTESTLLWQQQDPDVWDGNEWGNEP